MRAEIIAIGSELLLGQIVDTNSSFIAKLLIQNGIEVVGTSTAGDDIDRIQELVQFAAKRASIVITTGGIGPTEDDLTREAIAAVTGRPLTFQPHLMQQIEAHFKRRGSRMMENNRRQAYIPGGAIPIENPRGTAPGFIVEEANWVSISLPGVPGEMQYLMETQVVPYLRKRFKLQNQVIRYKVLRACRLGESAIGIQIEDLMKESKNPTVGTLASISDVRIRITAKTDHPDEASLLIANMETEIRKRLGSLIYGVDEETLQGNVARYIDGSGLTLSVVETVTGGLICHKLSGEHCKSLLRGIILPSRLSQKQFLGLSDADFDLLSGEPKELSNLLAQRALQELQTDITIAAFGVAPETKVSPKPIEIYCSLFTRTEQQSQDSSFGGEFGIIRERTSVICLDLLRRYLLKLK